MKTDNGVHALAVKYTKPVFDSLAEIHQDSPYNPKYEARKTDIIINTYPKAGTVLIQQMCYQIAVHSGGAPKDDPTGMEYDDISLAVPWIEKEEMPPSKTFPRLYKSHLAVTSFKPDQTKHLVIARSPNQFAASFLNFLFFIKNHELDADTVPEEILQESVKVLTDDFVLSKEMGEDGEEYKGLGTWHQRLKSATIPNTDHVFILFYEDVVKNLEGTVKRIAKFMGCTLTEEAVQIVAKLCDRKYMATDTKFDGHYERDFFNMKGNPPHTFPENYQGFKKYPISPEQLKAIEEMNMTAFGVKTFNEIRQLINEEQLKIHGY